MANQKDLVQILAIFLISVSALTTLVRVWTKVSTSKRVHKDDVAVLAALTSNIGSGVATIIAGANGLGAVFSTLDDSQRDAFQKSSYAAQLLTIPTLCLAKGSIMLLIRQLFPRKSCKITALYFGIFLGLWCLASVFVLAFQCAPPRTWDHIAQRCIDLTSFWRVSGAVNIVTDIILVCLPIIHLRGVQITARQRLIVIACFGARSLDIVASGTQLAYTGGFSETDITGNVWKWYVCNLTVQTVTIVTSNIPYLKRLLEAFPDATLLTAPYAELSRNNSSIGETPLYMYRETRNDTIKTANDESRSSTSGPREAYDMGHGGTRSTAQPVVDESASTAAVHRPAQIHIRQTIDVHHQSVQSLA